jgi:hypothetical protein
MVNRSGKSVHGFRAGNYSQADLTVDLLLVKHTFLYPDTTGTILRQAFGNSRSAASNHTCALYVLWTDEP